MSIRTRTLMLASALLISTDIAAQPAGSGYAPLRPLSECLDPGRVRSWQLLDDTRVLVDAGRRHYLVVLTRTCPELGYNTEIQFSNKGPGQRICGDLGEQILPSGSLAGAIRPCDIQRLLRISRDEYEAELGRGPRGRVEQRVGARGD